jgi:integrase
MAVEKVGIYRKWLEPVPKDKNGKCAPKSEWPRKRQHCWIARWYGTNGQRYGKVFQSRKEAERYASELQNRICFGKADKPEKITLQDFRLEHEQVMKGQVAYGTVQEHVRALKLFENFIGGSFVLSKIKPRHAEAFVADRLASKEVSIATVNKYIRTLHGIFNLAIEPRGYLAEGQNPFAKIKKRKITENAIRYVDLREYRALMDAAKKTWWKAFLSIAYGSGLRRNEILHLTWADIDLEQHRIEVRAKKESAEILEWEPKSRTNRVVPMSDEADQLLVNMQVDAAEFHPYVFVSPERLCRIKQRREAGKWHSRSQVVNRLREGFNTIRRRAKVSECTIHDLRRSAITNWAQRLPIQVVQVLAGHADIRTTRKYYLAIRPEDFSSAAQVLKHIMSETATD